MGWSFPLGKRYCYENRFSLLRTAGLFPYLDGGIQLGAIAAMGSALYGTQVQDARFSSSMNFTISRRLWSANLGSMILLIRAASMPRVTSV